ncbi:MAG TPA: TIGR01777 family oxidoreductase [Candidatus Methanoperedens sp.]|nr:TIGR01777 family oxidoreductase [Candidatus Methanoperedens sp.]
MKVFIVGGTGFVGVNLAQRLRARGDEVTVLGLSPARPRGLDAAVPVVAGDARTPGAWQERIAGHDVVINLAGASIFTRWTAAAKKVIWESRILATRNVVDALPASGVTLVSTSAVGYYGFHGDEELGEDDGPGGDFLARLCVEWEREAKRAAQRGARVVITRFGIVLGPGGGVLGMMAPLFRRYLGGRLGTGRQWFSWIHVEDLFAALLHVTGRPGSAGVYNFAAPGPATNRVLTGELARVLRRPALLPAPAFAVRLVLGEFGNVVLEGQRVLPRRLLAEGFRFTYPTLASALDNLAATI